MHKKMAPGFSATFSGRLIPEEQLQIVKNAVGFYPEKQVPRPKKAANAISSPGTALQF
jgi:hypothetical protein